MSELEALVRARFAVGVSAGRRIGIELEVLPVRAGTSAPVLPVDGADGPGTLGVLRQLGAARGWRSVDTGYGVPRFLLPDESVISYEPGGQIEWSSSVHDTLGALDVATREVSNQLADAMDAAGIHLLSRGVDPDTPLDAATMVIGGERYERQRAHYARRGEAGRAMMLQTAGIHVNLDPGDDLVAAWSVTNTLAPLLVAMFANSSARVGEASAHRSHRAAIWRALDPTRTAVFGATEDPAAEYLGFALGAESFLLGEPGAPSRSFAEWRAAGATDEDFARHLTTLFPEVRPRGGYLESRSVDTLPARWAILPAAVAWASVHHAPLRRDILRELPPPTIERLECAGRLGLTDPSLAAEACWLGERLPAALAAELPTRSGEQSVELVRRLESFLDDYTLRGLDPASAAESRL